MRGGGWLMMGSWVVDGGVEEMRGCVSFVYGLMRAVIEYMHALERCCFASLSRWGRISAMSRPTRSRVQ